MFKNRKRLLLAVFLSFFVALYCRSAQGRPSALQVQNWESELQARNSTWMSGKSEASQECLSGLVSMINRSRHSPQANMI